MDYDSDTIDGWESKGDFVNLILSKISARFVFFTKLIFKWDIKYLHTYRFVFSQFLTNRKSKISDKIISVADFSSISLTYLAISNPITMVLDLSTGKMNLNFSSKFDIEWLHIHIPHGCTDAHTNCTLRRHLYVIDDYGIVKAI